MRAIAALVFFSVILCGFVVSQIGETETTKQHEKTQKRVNCNSHFDLSRKPAQ